MLLDPVAQARRLLGCRVTLAKVLTDRPDRLVARLSTPSGDVVLKAGGRILPEVTANRQLREAGLPVADVLAEHRGEPEIVVLRWINGRPVTGRDAAEVLHDLGRLLRTVHEIGGGPPYAGGFPGVETWTDWMRGWLSTVLAWAPAMGFTADEVAECWRRFDAVVPMLDEVGYDFILFDGRAEHVLTDGARVVGLIDLTDAQPGDAGMDLAVLGIQEPGLIEPLLGGYAPDRLQRERLRGLVPLYALMRRLSSYEWNSRLGDPKVASFMLRSAQGLRWDRFPGL